MKNCRFTVLFDIFEFEEPHFYKDVGMIPRYLHQEYGWETSIVFFENAANQGLSGQQDGVRLVKLTPLLFKKSHGIIKKASRFLSVVRFLWRESRAIECLMLFHYTKDTMLDAFLYKFFNPGGKVYVKLDYNAQKLAQEGKFSFLSGNPIKDIFFKALERGFLKKTGLFSIETKLGYETALRKYPVLKDKLIQLANGADDRMITQMGPSVLPYQQKKNRIITVGRIGSPEKNHGLLLKALQKLDLQDWEVYFIGPVEPAFQTIVDRYFEDNPSLRGRVIFTGAVYGRQELYEWFNTAKVFCLTSDWESFAIVLVEALYFGCYILSTDVGASRDVTKEGSIGRIFDPGDAESLTKELQSLISGKTDANDAQNDIIKHSRENYTWSNLIKRLKDRFDLLEGCL